MTDTKYNGWTNRETWLVNLWFGEHFDALTEEGVKVDAEWIQDYVEEIVEADTNTSGGFVRDLVNTSSINYRELALHWGDKEDE